MSPRKTQTIQAIAIVIPAKNEQELITACLDSVVMAVGVARQTHPELEASIVLIADSCVDETVEQAREFAEVEVVELALENVGAARRAGAAIALNVLDRPAHRVWLANTDADSVVPPNWISEQLALADAGTDLMIGTVRPTFADLSPAQVAAWQHNHRHGVPNGHAHGANLGLRASLYLRAGGFPAIPEHEDNDLVDRIKALDATVVASDRCEVETSGRRVGRTDGGYARFLHGGQLESRAAEERTRA